MKNSETSKTQGKKIASRKAVEYLKDGMTIGIGTGSTVKFFVENLANKIKNGLKVTAVSTSLQTTQLAKSLGITLIDLSRINKIDITFDGADEVDTNLNGIKGGGGALLYEKIVASISGKNIWMVDNSKCVEQLGQFPLPVEVIPFGAQQLFKILESKGYNPEFRMNGKKYFISDGNHNIIDLHMDRINNPDYLNNELLSMAGIVETGLFIGVCDLLLVGEKNNCKIINKKRPVL